MMDMIYCECLKLKRSKILTVIILGSLIVPALVLFNSVSRYLKMNDAHAEIALFDLYDSAIMFLMLLFAPLVLSVVATFLINREYAEHTLKTVFTVPVSRKRFLVSKFIMLFLMVMFFYLLSWIEILFLAYLIGFFVDVTQLTVTSALYFLIKMLYGGVLLYLTITPMLYLGLRTKGYMTPFLVTAVVCLLNVVLSNSPVSGIYPWTATYLLVSGHIGSSGGASAVGVLLILLVFIGAAAGSAKQFLREDVG